MKATHIIYMTTVKAKAGKEQDVLQASLEVAKAARNQAGCIDYRILHSLEEAAVTMNFEIWTSEAARNEFNASSDVEKFITAMSGAFAEPPQPASFKEVV